jgi:PAS domain S-box-containing protein
MISGLQSDSPDVPAVAAGPSLESVFSSLSASEGSTASAYEHLIHLLPVAMVVCDASGAVALCNRRAAQMWAWEKTPAGPGTAWLKITGSAPLDVVLRQGTSLRNLEVLVRRTDGGSFEASLTIDPLHDTLGAVCGAIVVAVDIGERKKVDRQAALLAALSEQLASATTEADIVAVATQTVGEYLGVQRCGFVENERASGMLKAIAGWTREPLPTLAGRHEMQALGDSEWQRKLGSARIAIEDVTTDPHVRPFAEYYRTRGVRSYAGAPFVREGQWVATLTVTSDEPRRWTDNELSLLEHVVARVWPLIERVRSQTVLGLVTTNAPVVLGYYDRESRILFANNAFAQRWGLQPEELLGKHLSEVIGDAAFERTRPYVEQALSGRSVEVELELQYRNLGARFVRISIAPDFDSEGRVRGYLAAVSDMTDRRAMEQAIRDNEERFRVLAEHAPVGIFQTDAAGEYTFVNAQWCRLAGISTEAALGSGWRGAVHPHDRDRVLAEWSAMVKERIPYACEFRFMRADGIVTWLQASAVEYHDSLGARIGHIGTVVDITERKLAEFALRESEKRFRLVASRAPVGIFMSDPQGNTIFVNAAWCAMAGLSPDQACGHGWIDAIHPEDRERVVGGWDRAVTDGVSSKSEFRFLRRDGTVTWVHGNAVQLRDTNGRLTGYIGTVADFTDRKEAELALRESEERFRMLADNVMQFAWICDPGGRLLWANRRLLEYTGATFEELEAGKFVAMHHPEYVKQAMEKFRRRIETGEMWEDSFPLQARDGTFRWFLSRAIPIRDADGRITRWFGTNTDVTDLRETQEMLRKAQEELLAHAGDLERKVEARTASLREAIVQMEEFSYSVSHDLRAPLRAMNAYAQALVEDYGQTLDDTGRNYLSRIQRSSQRMEKLTHDVLTYSRLARAEIALTTVDVKAVVLDLVSQYAELQAPGAELVIEEPLHPVRGHEISLGQCLGNLLTNAAKFVPPGVRPRIRVFTTELNDVVRVSVADNGIGIPAEHQRNLFQVFQRVPTPTAYEGTGIGLAIVRKAAEKMNGRCGVDSTGEGGACFWIELPKP